MTPTINLSAQANRASVLYPGRSSYYDYTPIVNSFGEVVVQVDDDDYQGDTRVLLKRDGRYGFLVFGWGSCCGCDALQGCESEQEVNELIERLENDIKWFDSLEQAQQYINDEEARRGSYYYHGEEWQDFVQQVNNFAASAFRQ
jgi:hypothetical protein